MSDWSFGLIMILLAAMGGGLLLAYRYPALQLVAIVAYSLFLLVGLGVSAARNYWPGVIICGAVLVWLLVSMVRERQEVVAQGKSWPEPSNGPLFLSNWRSPSLRAALILGIIVGFLVPVILALLLYN